MLHPIFSTDEVWFFDTCYQRILVSDEIGLPHAASMNLPMRKIWEMIMPDECPSEFPFVAAGHFCISKEAVHRKPKEFYQQIVEVLETEHIAPWCIERMELFIFA